MLWDAFAFPLALGFAFGFGLGPGSRSGPNCGMASSSQALLRCRTPWAQDGVHMLYAALLLSRKSSEHMINIAVPHLKQWLRCEDHGSLYENVNPGRRMGQWDLERGGKQSNNSK